MLQMAEALEKGVEKDGILFDMNIGYGKTEEPINHCDTVCCIAGLACQMFAPEKLEDMEVIELIDLRDTMYPHSDKSRNEVAVYSASWCTVKDAATYLLDLTPEQADKLFQPTGSELLSEEPFTAKNAARVLKYMAHTGVCIWPDICDDYHSNNEDD